MCKIYIKIIDLTTMPPNSLQPLAVPPKWFHSWSLDFVSKLPELYNCNTILAVIDLLAKYIDPILYYIGQKKLFTPVVIILFIEKIVRQFGVPLELVHD